MTDIVERLRLYGQGDDGYRQVFNSVLLKAADEIERLRIDASRYRYLRNRPEDTIGKGGIFAGMTPKNVILTEEDLDRAVDAAICAELPK